MRLKQWLRRGNKHARSLSTHSGPAEMDSLYYGGAMVLGICSTDLQDADLVVLSDAQLSRRQPEVAAGQDFLKVTVDHSVARVKPAPAALFTSYKDFFQGARAECGAWQAKSATNRLELLIYDTHHRLLRHTTRMTALQHYNSSRRLQVPRIPTLPRPSCFPDLSP